jgi:hypothetical protein
MGQGNNRLTFCCNGIKLFEKVSLFFICSDRAKWQRHVYTLHFIHLTISFVAAPPNNYDVRLGWRSVTAGPSAGPASAKPKLNNLLTLFRVPLFSTRELFSACLQFVAFGY